VSRGGTDSAQKGSEIQVTKEGQLPEDHITPGGAITIPREFLTEEYKMLRAELHDLKACQVRLTTLAITATGAILGLGTGLSSGSTPVDKALLGLAFLSPLLVLFPFWWIFFDKAMSVSRVVGYQRVLEILSLRPDCRPRTFPGWENALEEFRREKQRLAARDRLIGRRPRFLEALKMLLLSSPFRYWTINFYLFAGLSAVCLGCAWSFSREALASGVLAILTGLWALSIVWTGSVLLELTGGKHSYASNFRYWKTVLGVRHPETEEQDH
jgi:hypothetical protein